ncbi:hypothetical protein KKF59_01390 [Patescibacteria group bacterium]|nr:hypothetical protein [Patescibacteria group bacterium]MBU1907768.1 hypothetical protein [Patescibacteria group bacterium]
MDDTNPQVPATEGAEESTATPATPVTPAPTEEVAQAPVEGGESAAA